MFYPSTHAQDCDDSESRLADYAAKKRTAYLARIARELPASIRHLATDETVEEIAAEIGSDSPAEIAEVIWDRFYQNEGEE